MRAELVGAAMRVAAALWWVRKHLEARVDAIADLHQAVVAVLTRVRERRQSVVVEERAPAGSMRQKTRARTHTCEIDRGRIDQPSQIESGGCNGQENVGSVVLVSSLHSCHCSFVCLLLDAKGVHDVALGTDFLV